MKVRGDVFTPGPLKMMMAQGMQLTFFGGLAVSLLGKGFLPAHAAKFLEDNKMGTLAALFMCNVMSGQLLNTGAFEIAYDGKPIWSKIETSRFPNLQELMDGLKGAGLAPGARPLDKPAPAVHAAVEEPLEAVDEEF